MASFVSFATRKSCRSEVKDNFSPNLYNPKQSTFLTREMSSKTESTCHIVQSTFSDFVNIFFCIEIFTGRGKTARVVFSPLNPVFICSSA